MADSTETFEQIRDIIASVLSVEPATITMSSRFGEELETDSVDLIEVVSEIEQRSGVTIEDQQLYELETVAELVELIDRLKRA